jgi:hypothetical protein
MKEIPEIFDRSFKLLMMLSNETIIAVINALFGDTHPLNSSVSYPNTEYITSNLEKRQADILIVIANIRYLLECQIRKDTSMVIRMFRYALSDGERSPGFENGVMIVCFPKTMLIDLSGAKGQPDSLVLELQFPDGGSYRYSCPVYKALEHSVEELERKGLTLLLPFYLLKLRSAFEKTADSEKREDMLRQVKSLRTELQERIERVAEAGQISESDAETIGRVLEYIYQGVYTKYQEGEEEVMGDAVYNAETFDMFESLVMQRKQWELKARENERQREESERQREELEQRLQESERQRRELEQKLRERGML